MSINRTDALQISRRYATAAFALAVEAKKEQKLVEEIAALAAAMHANDSLQETLANPIITHEQKATVLAQVMKTADALTQRTVAVIARGGRASLIPVVAEQLALLLAAHAGQVEATITSARSLSAATQKQLAQALAKATGKTVHLKLKEDTSVLGGLSIELGSLRLDATLAGALNAMRGHLLATTH